MARRPSTASERWTFGFGPLSRSLELAQHSLVKMIDDEVDGGECIESRRLEGGGVAVHGARCGEDSKLGVIVEDSNSNLNSVRVLGLSGCEFDSDS